MVNNINSKEILKSEKDLEKYLQTLNKDVIIELYLQKCFDFHIEKFSLSLTISRLKNKIKKMNSKINKLTKTNN